MQLEQNNVRDTLKQASIGLGASVEDLQSDTATNILGGAYILGELFRQLHNRAPSANLGEWYEVVAAYSGIENLELAASYTDRVFEILRSGVERTLGGEVVTLRPHPQLNADKGKYANLPSPPTIQHIPGYPITWRGPAHPTNYQTANRGAANITAIAIHVMEGTYEGSIDWAKKDHSLYDCGGSPCGASAAHYYLRTDGTQTGQVVYDKDIAYHVKNHNSYTIGIEHEGWISDCSYFDATVYERSGSLVGYLAYLYNIPVDRDHIKGHVEFSGNDHTDPGPCWDWTSYMTWVRYWYDHYMYELPPQ